VPNCPIWLIKEGYVVKSFLLNSFCLILLFASLNTAASLDYRLEYLGLRAVPDGRCPYFVTQSGVVAGDYTKHGRDAQPFIWKDGVAHDLNPPDGYKYIYIDAANNEGMVLASVSKKSGEPEACLCELSRDGTITYQMITAPGKGRTMGRCISDTGQIAGMTGGLRAFVWKSGVLKLLPVPDGVTRTEAWAINDKDQVAGTVYSSSGTTPVGSALLWSGDTVKVIAIPEGCDSAQPMFLNNKGAMVLRGSKAGSAAPRWFYWSDAGMQEILLPEERTYPVIRGFNDRGEAIGDYRYGGNTYAFVWQDGKLRYLSTLRQVPGAMEGALAINNLGQIVGHSTSRQCGVQAVLWQEGLAVPLASSRGERQIAGYAHYINDAGVILGRVEVDPGLWQIVLWHPER
jgi:probable HAF family extracellular repeat protein